MENDIPPQNESKEVQQSPLTPDPVDALTKRTNEARELLDLTLEALNDRLVLSYKDARATQTLDNMKLFEVRNLDNRKYILIPSNLKELASSNYLYLLFSKALRVMKEYCPLIGPAYKDNMIVTKETESFLNGYGSPLVAERVIPYDSLTKGSYKAGLYCMYKYLTNTYKNFDTRLFRFGESPHAVQGLFGEAWATTRLNEKLILDLVLNATKVVIDHADWIFDYIYPKEEIIKRYGLKVNKHISQTFSDLEQQCIAEDHKKYLNAVEAFEIPKFANYDKFQGWLKELTKVCAAGKKYKTICKNITDERMKFLYSGNKQEKSRKKKIPIKDLLSTIRGTERFVNTFQPNSVLGVPKFVLAKIPSDANESNQLAIQLTQWAVAISPKTATKDRVETCRNWILSESNFN